MPREEHGFKRAISEFISGLIMSTYLDFFANAGLIPPSLLLTLKALNLVAALAFIMTLPYWGTRYMLGWLLGFIMMIPSGIIDPVDLIIYVGIPLINLVSRFLKTPD